ncbi:MAG: hypothetical protein COX80_02870 [Candidatus Magasanikbacteria bacterium CG_4_10_14_0_2_um_filter_33_14]|uniref:Glycerophosphoryl diester phosphodiesterase membrane domain-containing protein n=1 Tax=Candidatus Magasanikbacteria bacterium CG_4_10_14_0_2_um_filter_33_14 TaxID=1974636 RepID=A0A2M7VAN8_9BACT|nr:MAG: hypothetical protein COX80_02870 [Candidatus Magasanikbacteria bacterium CG_4_10_14_0_2_um_filter_33_14]
MVTSLQSFFVKVFKTYTSSFLKLVPYLVLLFVFLTFVFFAQYSVALYLVLVPGTFFRLFFNIIGAVVYTFVTFMMTMAMIKVIASKYTTNVFPKVFKNIKETFFITLKNFFTLALLILPALLTYIVYFIGKMGYLSPYALISLFLLIIVVGILFFFWFSFVMVVLPLENSKGLGSFAKSIQMVKGRFGLVFTRLLFLFLFLFVTFFFYNEVAFMITQGTLFYLLFMFIFVIFAIPFYPVGFTVLYLSLQNEDMKKEALEENLLA